MSDMTHPDRLRRMANETDGLDETWLSEAADRIEELEAKLADMVGHLDDPETPEQWRTLVNVAPYVQVRARAAEKLLDLAVDLQRDLVAIYSTDCEGGKTCAARFRTPDGSVGCVHFMAQQGLERLGLDEEARRAAERKWLAECAGQA